MRYSWIVAAVIVQTLLAGANPARGADPLLDAAAARQRAIQSADIEFHLKAFYTKGYISGMKLPGANPKTVIPAADSTLEADNRLMIDGMRVRFEDNLSLWHGRTGELTHGKTYLAVSNGEMAKRFFPSGIGTGNQVSGIIARDGRAESIKVYYLTPLTTYLRGLEPAFAPYPLRNLKRTGRTLAIGGTACEEYSFTIPRDRSVRYWFDPRTAYTLRRIQLLHRSRVVEQTDIQYKPHEKLGLVPSSWLTTEYDSNGKVAKSLQVKVTKFRLNPSLPADQFDVQFPPGCEVFDERTMKHYRIQPSGKMREFTPSGGELPNEIPQPGKSWVRRNTHLLIGLAAEVGLLVMFCVVRRVRIRGGESHPECCGSRHEERANGDTVGVPE